jgi:hypothetical protein
MRFLAVLLVAFLVLMPFLVVRLVLRTFLVLMPFLVMLLVVASVFMPFLECSWCLLRCA